MKKILLVSGCSWTDKQFTSDHHPEMDTSWPKWPELLAQKLDMECVNLGRSGAGNEYIYNSLLEEICRTSSNKIGMVIPMWSGAERRDFQDFSIKPGDRKNLRGRIKEDNWVHNRVDEPVGLFASHRPGAHYFVHRSLRYWYSFQCLCEALGIKYKQVQGVTLYRRTKNEKEFIPRNRWHKEVARSMFESPVFGCIDTNNFIGFPATDYMGGVTLTNVLEDSEDSVHVSDDDRHPNALGQQIIADYIYENL